MGGGSHPRPAALDRKQDWPLGSREGLGLKAGPDFVTPFGTVGVPSLSEPSFLRISGVGTALWTMATGGDPPTGGTAGLGWV